MWRSSRVGTTRAKDALLTMAALKEKMQQVRERERERERESLLTSVQEYQS
ncbi:hypothetical protein E2C01_078723 [Portunus trituberculatus]|uniref:Uncharacterized protein n=1 Tax=Portunus trituberculatus TaxID=210409 RepID=A0A5B7ITJ8_PORTR|nr:hypothetical protein [Portunus trituberculatus]